MKVVVNGNEKVYTSTCGICHSDLEYTEKDVFYTTEETKGCLRMTKCHWFKADEHYTNIIKQEYRCVICPVCRSINKSISFRNGLKFETVRWVKEV